MSDKMNYSIEVDTVLKNHDSKMKEMESTTKTSAEKSGKALGGGFQSGSNISSKALSVLSTAVVAFVAQRAVKALVGFFKDVTAAADEQHRTTRLLSNTIKSLGEDVDVVLPEIQEFSDGLARIDGTANELTETLVAKLSRSLGSSSAAMDTVAMSQRIAIENSSDLNSVTNALHRAMETGTARSLRNYVGNIDQLQESLSEANTAGERQEIIMQALNKQYDMTEEVQTTLGEKMRGITTATADWRKEVGMGADKSDGIHDIMTNIQLVIRDQLIPATAEWMEDWWAGINRIARAVNDIMFEPISESEIRGLTSELKAIEFAQKNIAYYSDEWIQNQIRAVEITNKIIKLRQDEERERARRAQDSIVQAGVEEAEAVVKVQHEPWEMSEMQDWEIFEKWNRDQEAIARERQQEQTRVYGNMNSAYEEALAQNEAKIQRELELLEMAHQERVDYWAKIDNDVATTSSAIIGIHSHWSSDSLNLFGKLSGTMQQGLGLAGSLVSSVNPIAGSALAIGATVSGLAMSLFGSASDGDRAVADATNRSYNERTAQIRRAKAETINFNNNIDFNAAGFIDKLGLRKFTRDELIPAINYTQQRAL